MVWNIGLFWSFARLLLCVMKTLSWQRDKKPDVILKYGSVRTLWNYTSLVFENRNYCDSQCHFLQNKIVSLNFACTREPVAVSICTAVVWPDPQPPWIQWRDSMSSTINVLLSKRVKLWHKNTIYDLRLSCRLKKLQIGHIHSILFLCFGTLVKQMAWLGHLLGTGSPKRSRTCLKG